MTLAERDRLEELDPPSELYHEPTEDEIRRLEITNTLHNAIAIYGVARVLRWCVNLDKMRKESGAL